MRCSAGSAVSRRRYWLRERHLRDDKPGAQAGYKLPQRLRAGWQVATMGCMGNPPPWSTVGEALRLIAYRPHLRQTLLTALIVGTILFAINQLGVVLGGQADWVTWLKVGVTYCVPFAVANTGILIATRKEPRNG